MLPEVTIDREGQQSAALRFSPAGRVLMLFGISILLVVVTRLPLQPSHLFSFDSVNLALALEDFDPTRNQPQPPGYPLFVQEARLVYFLLGTPEQTFAVLELVICGLAVGMLYLLGRRMFSPWVGLTAAALLFVNPPFWYSSLTSPLRPHLALISALMAYCCWRAAHGEERYFELASLVLGLGAGFRPELSAFLLPLWAWTAWQCRKPALLFRGVFLLGLSTAVWISVLAGAGGTGELIPTFSGYLFAQTQDTSVLVDAAASWRRTAGRALIWTGLGTIPWIWTLPFGWKDRHSWPEWTRGITFLAIWFLPAFFFHFAIHIGDPDHALSTIPALCLVGGFCVVTAERILSRGWLPELKERGYLIWLALVGNMVLFFGQFAVPQRDPSAEFRGLTSVSDAVSIGLYESSYARVRWIEQMTDLGLKEIESLRKGTERPVLVLWARDGTPVWRKIAYYHPAQRIYVLDEKGDPGISDPQAWLWSANRVLARQTGTPPFRVPVPKGGRLIWVMGANTAASLQQVLPLQSFSNLYYVDLPPDAASIRWGSFELVPE
ncbi:MAG: hypothetical protein A3H28_11120 [Acidobacteria bacterium RIFCSPLOWO2_02_FULL_61_28]|nr:MAG: hypothetical protein A3H28_11120 [Acidobacteria bacterium RIFCSPLOWO2_02_FULL_61_28]